MSAIHFTLRQLEIFSAVLQTGQVRAAAAKLHLSQAAVSQAIQELAEALDVRLFEKKGRAIAPTRAAYRLHELSRGPCAELASLAPHLHGAANTPLAGPVHIAASSTIARYFLPPLLAKLAREYPALNISLSSGNSTRVEKLILDGQADLGFIEGPPQLEGLLARHWHTDHLEIIGPPDARPEISPDDLARWPWIMREAGSGTRVVFEQSLALAGLNVPPASIVIDDSSAQVRIVASGGGLACVSRAAAEAAVAAGEVRFIKLGQHVFARPLWSIQKRSDENPGLNETLLNALTGEAPTTIPF